MLAVGGQVHRCGLTMAQAVFGAPEPSRRCLSMQRLPYLACVGVDPTAHRYDTGFPGPYSAPVRVRTAGIVLRRIFRSSHSDQWSM